MAIIFFYGFEARCLFSVVFLHMMQTKAGYYHGSKLDSLNLHSRIKKKKRKKKRKRT